MSDDTKALTAEQERRLRTLASNSIVGADVRALLADRDALAERCEKLREALRNLLEAMETEARAVLAARNAEDNYSSPERELDALQNAMVAASNAEKAARTALAAPKDAPNESRCTHKSSKIMRGIDNTYDVAWCDELRDDAQRWQALAMLWTACVEVTLTQDEDGGWSITATEAVEAVPAPGRWTGDTPDDAADAIFRREVAQHG